MWLEVIGTTSALIGGATGTVCYMRYRKMPLEERRSIRNIQQVLRSFIKDGLTMQKVEEGVFSYTERNFQIEVHAANQTTKCMLKDDELNGDQIFFSFEYHNESKELLHVEEESVYYKRHAHYEKNETLLKDFIQHIMKVDWLNIEENYQKQLLAKYDVFEQTPQTDVSEAFELPASHYEPLQQWLNLYAEKYVWVHKRADKLPIDKAHALERNHHYLIRLCDHFNELMPMQQEKEWHMVKLQLEERTERLEDLMQNVQQHAYVEFQKVNHLLQTNNHV